ncbi:Serine phosphatase RsbU, regulator of sigma subunit [Olavius sp. associated proteobacterium Delta 1]|nr:Serine phosphatase RsbU, regulator of sigma subunit [Olavius sp. associated proteobacterium Delta 1]
MEVESLRREVTQLKTEKAALNVKSKLFEGFAAMANTCCRLPSSAEWDSLKNTLKKTLEFSMDLTGAENSSLILLDNNGVITDSIRSPGDTGQAQGCGSNGQVLDKGIAGWVRDHRQVGLITDTLLDNRWQAPPNQPQMVRSVLALPVIKCDELLGVLTLMNANPNHFSPESVEQMRATSDQIAQTIENTRLYAKLDKSYRSLDRSKQRIDAYSKALDEELEKGRQIQRDFLPQHIPELPNWDIATYFAPAKQVSGDFYDVFSLPGDNLGVVIADVADKGVGSALYMALIRSLIRVFSGHISLHGFANFSIINGVTKSVMEQCATTDQLNALTAVKLTNDYIAHEHSKEGMFATLFFGVINPLNGVLAYINGGHEPLIIVDASSRIKKRLDPTGPAVGMMVDIKFEIRQVQIEPGDILIGYTDGVIEAQAPNGDFFTRKRLLSIIEQTTSSASDLVDRIKTSVSTHVHNAPPSDDITMLAIKRLDLN